MKLPINYNNTHWRKRKEAREKYIMLQEGKCYYCGAPLESPASDKVLDKKVTLSLFPKGFFNYPIHLHHNHKTGRTIGAVHCHCNAVLWEYEGK